MSTGKLPSKPGDERVSPLDYGEDADRVLEHADRLAHGISRPAFLGVLNQFAVILASGAGRLDPRSKRREIKALKSAIGRLERSTNALRDAGFQPP